MINPITAEYISQAIDRAQTENASCLIIKLDTPGGLLSSTRQIVKKVLAARVPVIVYIAPGGARAGSAGVFLTYASHIAAMAPSTNIGAAHPVELGGQRQESDAPWAEMKKLTEKTADQDNDKTLPGKGQKPVESPENFNRLLKVFEERFRDGDPMGKKILQDTVAFIKTVAEKRKRNVAWAVKSVEESASITEKEALELGVVDFVAVDENELLKKLNGRVVELPERTVKLNIHNPVVKHFPMDGRRRFFNVLANPNIAYILMVLGFYGLLYEITHPGFGFPGILGSIFLILAFFSLQALPTNYAGLALILIGIILFVVEAFLGFGLMALGGLVSMFLGSLLLFDASAPMMRVSLSVILAFTLTTAGITTFLVRAVILAHRRKVKAGEQGMIGEKGEVYITIPRCAEGKVYVHGELWNAIADEELTKGTKVSVEKIDGLTLTVKRQV